MSDAPYGERRNTSPRFLPPDPSVSAPYRLTPGLALRVGVLGVIALAVFAVLFFRLWSLQVLSGAEYLDAAQNNQLRTIRVEAPRGPILDRNGRVIVANVPGTAVKLWVGDMPKQEGRYRMIQRLAAVLDVPTQRLAREVDARVNDPLTPITVKTAVRDDQVFYLQEHAADFPGVQIQQTYLRDYPYQSLAAQLLGYIGEVSPEELKRKQAARKDYRAGDKIGKSGVEATFDEWLNGTAGAAQIRVDSRGRQQSPLELRRDADPGKAVRLTLDIDVQRAAERAIREGVTLARANKQFNVAGGAIIAIDPRDGAVRAMASYPTYKPSVYVGRIDPDKLAPLVNDAAAKAADYPGLNRVTQVAYPPGSVWKPVTALAAMQEHILSPYSSIQCTPTAEYGRDKQKFKNWDPFVNRPMNLPEALATSCDTYFYTVGNRFYEGGSQTRSRMQQWARKFGFGAPTGLDIGNEAPSWQTVVPTPAWRERTFESAWDKAWNPGDSIQLAIGQKDVTVTPMQMARFYAMIANGGKLVTPYVVSGAEQQGVRGQPALTLQQFPPPPPRDAGVDPAALEAVREGLWAATHSTNGTSSGIFSRYSVSIAGKTGTAEKVVNLPGYPVGHLEDQSWWCGYGPSDDAELVVCAVIENGGHGSAAAAPAALRVFEKYFGKKAPPLQVVNLD
ncbi:penicillin-binding protein 2 [Gaiella sp.]|uniref:penicillin-binding protein 2 n=1 Tax=Gaiella sp. TaxID=2663207 RepID=UPI003263D99C